jgi:phasin family protein
MADPDHKPGGKSDRRKQKRKKKAEQKQQSPAMELTQAASEPVETAVTAEVPEQAESVAALEAALVEPLAEPMAESLAEPMESVAVSEAAQARPAERVASFRERMASVAPPAETAHSSPPASVETKRVEAKPVEAKAVELKAVPSPAAAPVAGIQAIANAYRDYTKQSLEDAQSFAEKLSAARSFDKAVEAQTEFARQACETFADNSRKIRELHRELFWQTFRLPNWPVGRSR